MPGAKKAKEERNEGSKAKGERESIGDMAYVEMRETKEAGLLCCPCSCFLCPYLHFPMPPSPGQFNGHAGRGTAEWAAAQGGSYGFRTSGGQAGTPA
ncbi:unnamed protein product [Sphagnum troendelagicum]|uniref:Uncharacterized protein n=1 Tax=Sphagnum troendelagicum TaxID=128251 RepID=A0ABP0U5Q0_9BRYO